MEIDKYLPAFPVACVSQNNGSGETVSHQSYGGMTLRDYFAAKAMQALIHAGNTHEQRYIAQDAYGFADAMIEARGV